jgi:hypothetical protein
MKRLSFAALMLVLGIASLYGQEKIPNIFFNGLMKDFGRVTAGETLAHVFSFTNKGSDVLEIVQVRPT